MGAFRSSIACALLILIAVLPLASAAQSVFRGENLLAFAERLQANATAAAVYAALEGVFERLDISVDRRKRYGYLKSAQVQRVKGGADLPSVASTILLSAGAVKIGKAENALIIAEGDVDIAEARGTIVVSRGRVRIQRETEPGIYVSRRAMEIGNAVSPIVYAVDGARVGSREPFTAYNTAVTIEGGLLAYKYTRAPLFQGEPVQAPAAGHTLVNTGESMSFAGARCKTAIAGDVNVLSQMLPYARKRANCQKVDSASVRCEQESGVTQSASKELWTLRLCGRPMTLLVQSKQMGKDSKTGEPTYDHSIVVQSGAQPPRAPKPLQSKPTAFAAEDALALAGVAESQLKREQVVLAVQRVFEALQLPPELRSKYAYMGSARLQLESGYTELTELSESILVADGAVNIGYARNSIVIASGPVKIAHGGGLIVIADGSVDLSHENGFSDVPFAPGVYVTRGEFKVSFAAGPVIYALRGADLSHSGKTTLINTDFDPGGSGIQTVKYTVAPLFSGEPQRTPVARPLPPSAPFQYGGQRCPDAMPDEIEFLHRMQAYVRKEANCTEIKSVAVQCAQAPTVRNSFASNEQWTFELCGRKTEVRYTVQGWVPKEQRSPGPGAMSVTTSMNVVAPPPPPLQAEIDAASAALEARVGALTPDEGRRRLKLYDEGFKHLVGGNLIEARDNYREALAIIPSDSLAASYIRRVENQIARSDEFTASVTARIERGGTARDLAERGLLRVRYNDVGRGLQDLNNAVERDNADSELALDRAWGLLMAGRLPEADAAVSPVLARNPRATKGYEIRAWSGVRTGRSDAYKDALSSLSEGQPWTRERFAAERGAYRAILGYLALHQAADEKKALDWLRQWRPMMSVGAWPDAFVLYKLGEIDEERMKEPAASLKAGGDRGNASAEAFVFMALVEKFEGNAEKRRKEMQDFFRTSYSAGRTIAYGAYNRFQLIPGAVRVAGSQ